VGYGKTGSTALQAWLAACRDSLARNGIDYPLPEAGLGDSGNGALLLEALQQSDQRQPWLENDHEPKTLLLSREHLARELSGPGACARLTAWCERWGLAPIRILLLVRDPQEHCYSLWAQKVKRAGERRSLQRFAASYDAITMARHLVQAAGEAGIELAVRDYGQWRQSLVTLLLRWLEVDAIEDRWQQCVGAAGTARPINVTPSYAQLRLQRRLNQWRHGARPAGPPPPAWLAGLWPGWSVPQPYSLDLLARWQDEVAAFNSVAARVTAADAEPMPMPMISLEPQG